MQLAALLAPLVFLLMRSGKRRCSEIMGSKKKTSYRQKKKKKGINPKSHAAENTDII